MTLIILTGTYSNGQQIVSSVQRSGEIPHETARLKIPFPVQVHEWHRFGSDWRLVETYVHGH